MGFNNMPCYDVVIDANDVSGESIVVGTEFGIFVTDDGGDSGPSATLAWRMARMASLPLSSI